MNNRKEKTFSEVWGEFVTSQTVKGVADIAIRNSSANRYGFSRFNIPKVRKKRIGDCKNESGVI